MANNHVSMLACEKYRPISKPDYQYGLKIKLHLFLNGTTNIVMYKVQKSIFGY